MESRSISPKSSSRTAAAPTTLFLLVLGLAVGCSDSTPTSPNASSSGAALSASVTGRLDPVVIRSTERTSTRQTLSLRGGTVPSLQGSWGGPDIGVTISESGAAVQFDCAGGSINAPFVTDSSGHFELPGTWWFTPPVLPNNWQPDKRPARYSGNVNGNTMRLSVTRLDDLKAQPMLFLLVHGAMPRIVRCL